MDAEESSARSVQAKQRLMLIRGTWEFASDKRHRLTTTSEHDVTEKGENAETKKKCIFKPFGQMGCAEFTYTIRPQND